MVLVFSNRLDNVSGIRPKSVAQRSVSKSQVKGKIKELGITVDPEKRMGRANDSDFNVTEFLRGHFSAAVTTLYRTF